jgi:hypothetical protein
MKIERALAMQSLYAVTARKDKNRPDASELGFKRRMRLAGITVPYSRVRWFI